MLYFQIGLSQLAPNSPMQFSKMKVVKRTESCKEDKESYLSDLDLKSITPMPSLNFTNDFNPCVERTIENKCLKIRFSIVNAPNNCTKWMLNSGAMDHIMRNPKLLRNSSN
jgi:hypothetical protein